MVGLQRRRALGAADMAEFDDGCGQSSVRSADNEAGGPEGDGEWEDVEDGLADDDAPVEGGALVLRGNR